MRKISALLLGFTAVFSVHAQEAAEAIAAEYAPPEVVEAPADGAAEAPAEASAETPSDAEVAEVAEAPVAEEAAPEALAEAPVDASAVAAPTAETGDVPADAAAVDPAMSAEPVAEEPVAEPVAEAAAEDPFADPFASGEEQAAEGPKRQMYLGAAYNDVTVSFSDAALTTKFGAQELAAKMYTLRVGIRVFDVIGLEFHGGAKDGINAGAIEMGNYYGLFVVPTANVFDLFEVSAAIGYNAFIIERGNIREKFMRPAYGLNAELPIRQLAPSMPDLRLTTGYKVFYAQQKARVYGLQLGLRYDFQM